MRRNGLMSLRFILQNVIYFSHILAKKRLKNEQKIAVFCFSSFTFCVNFRILKAFRPFYLSSLVVYS